MGFGFRVEGLLFTGDLLTGFHSRVSFKSLLFRASCKDSA